MPIGIFGQTDGAGGGDALQSRGDVDAIAHQIAVALLDHIAEMDSDAELDAALTSFTQNSVGAFLVAAAPFFDTRLNRIVGFAAQNRLPGLYHFREYAVAGGLMSYGPNVAESYHNAGDGLSTGARESHIQFSVSQYANDDQLA